MWCFGALFFCMALRAVAVEVDSGANALRVHYADLGEQLRHNQFDRPLVLHSTESQNQLKGDIYAVIDAPFGVVNEALNGPTHWCDVLMLHLNTKYCRLKTEQGINTVMMRIGKKFDQPLTSAYQVDFTYKVANSTSEYFDVRMNAKKGPLGTNDYQIRLESVALSPGKTFLHLTYSYGFGMIGSFAMRAYLATGGSDKVGFTRLNDDVSNGYIGGVRGVVERNTMRYYLAIDAYLSAAAAPQKEQGEVRLRNWFNATERYPRQLHEIERDAYIKMKRNEFQRMLSTQ
jgi:hypothetical protein